MTDNYDPITNPKHYVEGRRYQPIDILQEWAGHDALLWQTLKYLSRAGRKGPMLTDLLKSRYYLQKLIEREEAKQ